MASDLSSWGGWNFIKESLWGFISVGGCLNSIPLNHFYALMFTFLLCPPNKYMDCLCPPSVYLNVCPNRGEENPSSTGGMGERWASCYLLNTTPSWTVFEIPIWWLRWRKGCTTQHMGSWDEYPSLFLLIAVLKAWQSCVSSWLMSSEASYLWLQKTLEDKTSGHTLVASKCRKKSHGWLHMA